MTRSIGIRGNKFGSFNFGYYQKMEIRKEIVYAACMYKLKMNLEKYIRIDNCEEVFFGDLMINESRQQSHGLFTNKTALSIIRKTNIKLKHYIGEIIPPKNDLFKSFEEIFSKYAVKEAALSNKQNR